MSLLKFYNNQPNTEEIINFLEGNAPMSLRLIDWFVTNYAKKNNIGYMIQNQEFLVYNNYKSQLKAYSKKMFDPFCRRERIDFQIADTILKGTTVGKLNFFRWALEKGVIQYIAEHHEEIEKEMNECLKEDRKIRSTLATASTNGTNSTTSSSTSQRTRISKKDTPAAKQMHKNNVEIVMSFD